MMKNQEQTGRIDFDPSIALEKIDSWVDGFFAILPNLVVALVVFLAFWLIGSVVNKLMVKTLQSRERANLGDVLGGLFKVGIMVLGGMLALTIVSPDLSSADLVASLGIGSVAIGFAFKDILQNWLAGLLLLLRQPFDIGDQIKVDDFEGTVERIETRATIVRTYHGERAVIPNSQIYTSALLVKTGYPNRRSQYDIGIGYGDDIQEACEIIVRELKALEGIESDPMPEAFPWDLATSWVTIRARWWTDSKRGSVVYSRSNAIMRIKHALEEAGIDIPFETQVHLFHDQTEDRDGLPGTQREGWPASTDIEVQPRWKVQHEKMTQG